MDLTAFANKSIVIWGTGREGVAAAQFLRAELPTQELTFIDENAGAVQLADVGVHHILQEPAAISAALDSANLVIKSPGVSLYHPLLDKVKARGTPITSLMNLWFAAHKGAQTLCVTGSKGKSTTASLLNHTLNRLGKKSVLLGNIGTALSRTAGKAADYIVIEVSSYQAANFDGLCDLALLTALYPEHLDWHKSLHAYYNDKLNLLRHARHSMVSQAAYATLIAEGFSLENFSMTGLTGNFHFKQQEIYAGKNLIGAVTNTHLSRAHNLANVCLVLAALQKLGCDPAQALAAMQDFQGLPHRQYELGEKESVLFVDDSISTTPQSTIAALEVYRQRAISLIAGGFDRGIDYAPLADYLGKHPAASIILMGPSGARIAELLKASTQPHVYLAATMADAVAFAKNHTPRGGVILLSPAAPSYGLFKNFEERGQAFAQAAGFNA